MPEHVSNIMDNKLLTPYYQRLVLLELNKLEKSNFNFNIGETFLSYEETKKIVPDHVLKVLLKKELLITYDKEKYRTAHVDLIWRVLNVRAYKESLPRASEYVITYDVEPLSSFEDYNIDVLKENVRAYGNRRIALDIVIKALKKKYKTISHYQRISLETILNKRGKASIGLIAPTASGKTLIFMVPILIEAVEKVISRGGFKNVVAVLCYPRKALAKDQVDKLIELVYHVNRELIRRYGKSGKKLITIGLDYGDIRRTPPKDDELFLGIKCPKDGEELILKTNGEVYCKKCKETLNYIHAYKLKVWKERPHIYVTNIWTLYRRLMDAQTLSLFKNIKYVILDEAHVYAGYLGGHVYYILKLLKHFLKEKGDVVFIFPSATIPKPLDFLKNLTGENVEILDHNEIVRKYYSKDEAIPQKLTIRVYMLPSINTSVETLAEESILPITLWAHKYGLKSIVFIDSIAEINTIFNYVYKTILGIREGREILDHLYLDERTLYENKDNYSWTTLAPKLMYLLTRKELQTEWILKDYKESINIHYGGLPKIRRTEIEKAFKAGKIKTLLATSTLELGIDIDDVAVILQYKLPRDPEGFIQRIGRAGRSINCYRTSLGFVALQSTPIAALYLFDKELRRKLERLEELEALKISLESESIMVQHIISALLYLRALEEKHNHVISSPPRLSTVRDLLIDLLSKYEKIDEITDELKLVKEEQYHIYNRAKETVKTFLKDSIKLLEYLIEREMGKKLKRLAKEYEKLEAIVKGYFETMQKYSRISSNICELLKDMIKICPSIRQEANEMLNFLEQKYKDLVIEYKQAIGFSIIQAYYNSNADIFIKLRRERVIDSIEKKVVSLSDDLSRLEPPLRKKTLLHYISLKPLSLKVFRGIGELKNILMKLIGILSDLKELLSVGENEIKEVITGVPSRARFFGRAIRSYKREHGKIPNTLRVIELLTQVMGYIKFTPILEEPSVKVLLRET